jgi:hypothetical protein
MAPSTTEPATTTDRQRRVRRLTGLVAAGAAIATAAVALPALAATTDPQAASSSETTVTSAEPTTTSAAPATTSTTAPAPPAPTPEELLLAQLATATPEQKLAFDLYTASPEQREAWAAYISPPPPPAPEPAPAAAATGGGTPPNGFLACVRQRESGGNYAISSANGLYRGAYQFHQQTWNSTAAHAGRSDLVGADPAAASPADQDAMAAHLYGWQGSAPWGGAC